MQTQVWQVAQMIAFEHDGTNFKLVMGTVNIDVKGASQETARAYVAENTAFIFTNGGANPIKITGTRLHGAAWGLSEVCMELNDAGSAVHTL